MFSFSLIYEDCLALSNLVTSKMMSPVASITIVAGPVIPGFTNARRNNNVIFHRDYSLCHHLLSNEVKAMAEKSYLDLLARYRERKKPPAKGGGRGLLK